MADYLLVCDPEKFAQKFPDIDPLADLRLKRMNVLGREVLFVRYSSPISVGERFPDGYDRERLAHLLPYSSTKSNKHEFAQSVLSDEDTLRLRLVDWVEYDGEEEDEFYSVPENVQLKASIDIRKVSEQYKASWYYIEAFHWFAQNCQILDLQLNHL